MVLIEPPEDHPYQVVPPRIQPRVEPVHKIIAPRPNSGVPHRLDLEELLGDRLEGFAEDFWSRIVRYDARAELNALGVWQVVSDGEKGCWGWTGRIDKKSGYGIVRVQIAGRLKVLQAHRVAWALADADSKGTSAAIIPEGVLVRHRCRLMRKCCNPRHLFLGNYYGNAVSPEEAA